MVYAYGLRRIEFCGRWNASDNDNNTCSSEKNKSNSALQKGTIAVGFDHSGQAGQQVFP
jgi:hypothetical protein